jgi:hypothetical protein
METTSTLRAMIEQARRDVQADNERWANLACGQDSEEAEESGRLVGYLEGLEEALKMDGESERLRQTLRDVKSLMPAILSNAAGVIDRVNAELTS